MSEVSTNTTIAPSSLLGSLRSADNVTPTSRLKQPEQEIATLPKVQESNKCVIARPDWAWREPRELYYAIIRPEDNVEFESLTWVESATASIDAFRVHHSGRDTIAEVLKRGLLKRFHAITQQESNEVSPPFSKNGLMMAPLDANIYQEPTAKSNILRFLKILQRLDDIAQREDNWDGYESKSPNKLSLNNARQFMNEFVDAIVSEGEAPLTPSLISSDEDGHITVEWRGEGRQLHLQIEEDEIDYIQVWGPNIDTEMHVDTLHSKDYLTLWKWLIYGK